MSKTPRTITLRRVVVTGMGALTDIGLSAPATWAAMKEGKNGVDTITAFTMPEDWPVRFAGQVKDWNPAPLIDVKEQKRMDRFAMMALGAADEAVRDSGFDFNTGDPYRHGVMIGSGVGGILSTEESHTKLLAGGVRRVSPFTVPRLMVNAGTGQVSIRFNLRGPSSATATACASSGHAIGAGYHAIQRGDADVILAGGSEAAVGQLCIGTFAAMKALSTKNDTPMIASRPFDKDRDGVILAVGAAVLVLEDLEHAKARGARIYAELVGFGACGDAYHIAAPDEQGSGAFMAMTFALRDAQLNTTDVDYINAHGTSTPLGDAAEVSAVKRLFGDHAYKLCMSSTKSMTGHGLGAAGGIESIASIMALHDGVVPPTINLDHPDEGFDLNFVAKTAQERPMRVALNNTFGFGGHNVSLCFATFED